jgi:hypothetical protein
MSLSGPPMRVGDWLSVLHVKSRSRLVGEVIDMTPFLFIRTPKGVVYELTIGDTVRVMDPIEVLAMLG